MSPKIISARFCSVFSEKIESPATIQALENIEAISIKQGDFQDFIAKSTNAKNMYTKIWRIFRITKSEELSFSPNLHRRKK
ncbi:hypothetical protein MTP09_10155 [Chryseobacterium suipulveris]|uniref:Uncharacterized protein n=1 Tax=Chryseobacterium suipulveris TaxID=2929800 RepID=A0ABY4BRD0_9FLAO|nr:hypothetical protein [Chryseobacterium suipulveris]UOE40273.1 hypothetical protein MTP09_10155 [Chryseobacterium suipulveris]